MSFSHLSTPCLLLDKHKVQHNIARMQEKAARHNVVLRPHLKTSKSVDVVRLFGAEGQPITVSTLREAEYFAAAGYRDILYAVGIEPGKFSRLAKLYQQGVTVTVILDSVSVAEALIDFCQTQHITISVMIEIDADSHRAGLKPAETALVDVAARLHRSDAIHFVGLMTHAGGSYDCTTMESVSQHAEQEQSQMIIAAERCRDAGIPIGKISIGSTPTVVAAQSFEGIDEIRPGVFVFFDMFQMQLGVCEFHDIALSVLCSVVAHRSDKHCLIVDAGGLALSKDRSTEGTAQDIGFGLVCDVSGRPLTPPVYVKAVNQEHGIIPVPESLSLADFPIGHRLRIFPNHACMTAAAYEGYMVLESERHMVLESERHMVLENDNAIEYWPRCNGW